MRIEKRKRETSIRHGEAIRAQKRGERNKKMAQHLPKMGQNNNQKNNNKKKSDHKVRSKIEEMDCLHTVCFLFFFSSQRLYF